MKTTIFLAYFIFNIIFSIPLIADTSCGKAYIKKRFQLVAKMALAKKKNDLFNYVKYQYWYSQYLSTEHLLKEYSRNIKGEETRDFYIRFQGKKTPKEIDQILSIFSKRDLFCSRKDKKSNLELFGIDELAEFVSLIQ